jgi:hypothetical protein
LISSIASLRMLLAEGEDVAGESRIAIARPIAGVPLTRNIGCGGSAVPRRTVGDVAEAEDALAGHEVDRLRMSLLVESKAPETRTERPVPGSVSISARAGRTRFCACNAAISCAVVQPAGRPVVRWRTR